MTYHVHASLRFHSGRWMEARYFTIEVEEGQEKWEVAAAKAIELYGWAAEVRSITTEYKGPFSLCSQQPFYRSPSQRPTFQRSQFLKPE